MKRFSIYAIGLTSLVLFGCPGDDSGGEGEGDGSTGSGSGGATDTGMDGMDGVDDALPTGGSADGDATDDAMDDDPDSGSGDTMGMDTGDDADSGDSDTGGSDSGGSESGSSSDGMMVEDCEAPGDLVTCDAWGDDVSWDNVLGLNCPGTANQAIPATGMGFNSPDSTAWSMATRFGSFEETAGAGDYLWVPTEGEQMLVLSSGQGGSPDSEGVVTFSSLDLDDNDNPDNKPLPAPMSPQPGSSGIPFTGCDDINDCSDSLINQWNAGGTAANDLLWAQFTVEVPAGTFGFSFDFAYFSEEFPEWVGTTFNDMFVVWSNSESYVGNLCFIDDQPCTVTALWPTQYQAGDPELADTGFNPDAATGWFQIKGSAEPHEDLQLTLAVFDMGDTIYDTLVLLDHFAWDCEGCTPTEVNPCGVVDPT